MAKGQKRSNREVKKPKKAKLEPAPSSAMTKGISIGGDASKKK